MRGTRLLVGLLLIVCSTANAAPVYTFYDESLLSPPLAANGPGDARYRLGATDVDISRFVRPNDHVPPANVYKHYEYHHLDGASGLGQQGGAYPRLAPGQDCPYGGVPPCPPSKNHTGVSYMHYAKSADTEDAARFDELIYSGPGDAIGYMTQLFALGSNPEAGGEGAVANRIWMFDVPPTTPKGKLTAAWDGTSALSTSITLGGSFTRTIEFMGDRGLIVFDDAALPDRKIVNAVSYDNARRVWKVAPMDVLPVMTYDPGVTSTGYCFTLDASARGDYRLWLPILHGPNEAGLAANEFETGYPNRGGVLGAPPNFVPNTNWPDFKGPGRIAPCESMRSVETKVNSQTGALLPQPTYAVAMRGIRSGRLVPAGIQWVYSANGPTGQFRGVDIVMHHSIADPWNSTGVMVESLGDYSGGVASSTPIRAPYASYAAPVGAPLIPGQANGIAIGGPASAGAFSYQPFLAGPGWSEAGPAVVTEIRGDFGTPAADDVKTEMVNGVCRYRVESIDTVSRAKKVLWFQCPGTYDRRQAFELSTRPSVIRGARGDKCDDVCKASSLACTSWKPDLTPTVIASIIIGSSWVHSGQTACTEALTDGGDCHCARL